jgi:hypothetical protein
LVGGGSSFQVGYVAEPDRDLDVVDSVDVAYELDADDLPVRGDLEIGRLRTQIVPELHAPVLIASPDGATSRFARALCRFDAADGTVGRGWVELNLPVASNPVTDTRAG